MVSIITPFQYKLQERGFWVYSLRGSFAEMFVSNFNTTLELLEHDYPGT
jgi:hypothetical protein